MRPCAGKPYPLGAIYDGRGVNFSLFSSVAERVELCLIDENGEEVRHDLPEMTALCWHGYFPGLRPGQRYGFRIHGPWEPTSGHLCNPKKLLLDPYARCIQGQVKWSEAVFARYFTGSPGVRNDIDSAASMPLSVVTDSDFEWKNDQPPRTPWEMTVIYEIHVKGFTMKAPAVPAELRGTYLGLAHPRVIQYFKDLGVTAIELMPVHQFVNDMHLSERGLGNYWGYNTIGFFAPHNDYATTECSNRQVQEFKHMVQAMHQAGLEVILDVVYGHTAEGNHLGPLLSFKGIDNSAYYRLDDHNPVYYKDYTGTGNSLNVRQPHVVQLIMDSLRYWVSEMHVDGFRFDLASTLARGVHDVDRWSAFFHSIQQDPVVSQVKLIAEPWDFSDDGYQLGNFPPLWSEWNGQFRDGVRDFWRGCHGTLRDFSYRLSGSPDLYEADRRRPRASINFVTCHDGFTLGDLVSYNAKHNAANGERNLDGESNNRSWNCGCEGSTSDKTIITIRERQKRNFLATLILSQGVPMLLGGDEVGRTQGGNNNAYCQDNSVSWVDWENADPDLLNFVAGLIDLRREHPVFRRRVFADHNTRWYRNDGQPMNRDDWDTEWIRAFGLFLDGAGTEDPGSDFYIAFNSHSEALQFTMPFELRRRWRIVLRTATRRVWRGTVIAARAKHFCVEAHSLIVARSRPA